jgi:sarcosine oxidase, subunit beta
MAQCIASGQAPQIIAAFSLERFAGGALVGEKGAAAVGH